MKVDIVDVFAERALAGNQLAVVHDAARLSTEQMQDIAREMNFSETTFVIEASETRARVRIFTPSWELPFAGHPTIGTAWVLGRDQPNFTLDLDAGPVPVEFDGDLCWMAPPAVEFGSLFDAGDAAALIGLEVDQLDDRFPLQLARVGPRFVIVGVKNLATLRAAKLNDALHKSLTGDGEPLQCVFVFTDEPYGEDADFAARMFFDSGGVREDPATGSANAAFAAYLHRLDDRERLLVVDQGVEIQRPSRLYLHIPTLRVGGKVQPVLCGDLAA